MWRRIFHLSGFRLCLLITVIFIVLSYLNEEMGREEARFGFLENLEYSALDLKFKDRGTVEPSGDVVIVAIDETSISELGRWPWPRRVWADLLDRLNSDYRPAVVAFDAVFSEPYNKETLQTLRNLQEEISQLSVAGARKMKEILKRTEMETDQDLLMTRAVAATPQAVMGYFFFMQPDEIADLNEKDQRKIHDDTKYVARARVPVRTGPGVDISQRFPQALGVRANIPSLSEAAKHFGYFNFLPDPDATFRRVHMLYFIDGQLYPSLTLATLSAYFDEPIQVMVGVPQVMEEEAKTVKLMIGERDIPVDEHGAMLINFYGYSGTIPTIPIIDILKGKVPRERLEGKAVMIGPTTIGIYDLRPNPFIATFPGVEIHASAIENVIHDQHLERPPGVRALEILVLLAVGLGLGTLLTRLRLTYGLLMMVGATGIIYYADRYLLFAQGLWLKIVFPIAFIWILFLAIAVYRYLTEERQKHQIKKAFQFYMTKSVVDEVLKDTTRLKLGGDKRELTVLFSDVRGFTSISERLSPEDLVHLLNEYLTPMTNIIFQHEGTLDKYMGDAIMAIFGAPLEQPDHARRACQTALDMMEELRKLRRKWQEEDRPLLNIGIGLNTGPMSVGNMGSDVRFDYTVMGDMVNLGSRLEGANKQYGTNIIISEYTHNACRDGLVCRELDLVRVKGKREPVKIYELIALHPVEDEVHEFIDTFGQGIIGYREQRWEEAIRSFEAASKLHADDHTSRLYIERCRRMKEEPPGADWDGVFEMKVK